jgi:NADH dehydrogenase
VLLAAFSRHSQAYAQATLADRGVEVCLRTAVAEVAPDRVVLRDAQGDHDEVPTRTLIWAAGVRSATLADVVGAQQGRGGRIIVHRDLSLPGHPEAFAVGDVAQIAGRGEQPLPQLAQVAMQSGGHAAEQILNTIARRPRVDFSYRDKGIMATIGRRAAVAELPGGVRLTGGLAWLAWLGLHLVYLLGVRNRVSVFVNWAWNYLTWDRGPRLILRSDEPRRSLVSPPGADTGPD